MTTPMRFDPIAAQRVSPLVLFSDLHFFADRTFGMHIVYRNALSSVRFFSFKTIMLVELYDSRYTAV